MPERPTWSKDNDPDCGDPGDPAVCARCKRPKVDAKPDPYTKLVLCNECWACVNPASFGHPEGRIER